MKSLIARTITGVLFVALLVFGIIWHDYTLAAILLLITLLGSWEFLSGLKNGRIEVQTGAGLVFSTLTYLLLSGAILDLCSIHWLFLLLPCLLGLFILELFRNKEGPFTNIGLSLLPSLYIALPSALINQMEHWGGDPSGHSTVLGVFILIWTNDTGAYVFGNLLGKHKLFERISPGKTWEGSFGSALLCLLGAWVLSVYFSHLPLEHWLIIGLLTVVFGTFGDLTESLFKRSMGIKDSGQLLPGHGGVLDRFDAFLFAGPAVTAYLVMIH